MTLLNLVFHKIIQKESERTGEFDVLYSKYKEIIEGVERMIFEGQVYFNDYCIYFDDGEDSFIEVVLPEIPQNKLNKFKLAIITDWVGLKGMLKVKDLQLLQSKGITITSHGVSHAALAVSKSIQNRSTLPGGSYSNSAFGLVKRLKSNEVLFQYKESLLFLRNLGLNIEEFVFPNGLYNSDVIRINKENNLYKYLSTCDNYLDSGEDLKPRYLVWDCKSIKTTLDEIKQLKIRK